MRLAVYSSIVSSPLPNLIAVQNEDLSKLPTILVCPCRDDMEVTSLRVEVEWETKQMVACPELTRPIRRSGLHARGWLDEASSRQVIDRLQLLIAE